jgi:hypothetical protein
MFHGASEVGHFERASPTPALACARLEELVLSIRQEKNLRRESIHAAKNCSGNGSIDPLDSSFFLLTEIVEAIVE